jgi:methanogenic corrinoid protein MtbC1
MTELEKKSLHHIKDIIINLDVYKIHRSIKETLDKGIENKEVLLKHIENGCDEMSDQKNELRRWLDSIISSIKQMYFLCFSLYSIISNNISIGIIQKRIKL